MTRTNAPRTPYPKVAVTLWLDQPIYDAIARRANKVGHSQTYIHKAALLNDGDLAPLIKEEMEAYAKDNELTKQISEEARNA